MVYKIQFRGLSKAFCTEFLALAFPSLVDSSRLDFHDSEVKDRQDKYLSWRFRVLLAFCSALRLCGEANYVYFGSSCSLLTFFAVSL